MAESVPTNAILLEVLPRDAASLSRGLVRLVLIGVGAVFALIATMLAMFFVANGTLTIEVLNASAIAFLIFAAVPVLVVGPVMFFASRRFIYQCLPRSTTVVGDQVVISSPGGSVAYPLVECKWSIGRSTWEWLGVYFRSHPTTLLLAPTGFVYLLGTDQASAAQHAAVLSGQGVEQVNYVSPVQRVFRRASWVIGGIGLGWVIGAAVGAAVGFAMGDPGLYRTFAAAGMLVGVVIAYTRFQQQAGNMKQR